MFSAWLVAELWEQYLTNDQPEAPYWVGRRGRVVLIVQSNASDLISTICFDAIRQQITRIDQSSIKHENVI